MAQRWQAVTCLGLHTLLTWREYQLELSPLGPRIQTWQAAVS